MSSQLPPLEQSIPCCLRNMVACPLRLPLAQHKTMGCGIALISAIRAGTSCSGMLILPSTLPPANSAGVRTSIMVIVLLIFLFYKRRLTSLVIAFKHCKSAQCKRGRWLHWLHSGNINLQCSFVWLIAKVSSNIFFEYSSFLLVKQSIPILDPNDNGVSHQRCK